MNGSAGKHYGLAAVSRSLRHFILGKSFAVVSAFAVLFLLARVLEPAAYAVYISLQALIVLIGRVSGFGVQKVMLRYLPEMRATGNNEGAFRLLWQGTILRAALVGLTLLLAWWFLPSLGHAFGLDEWLWLVPWYLLLGFMRLMNQWTAAMLESFLWQREAQYSIAVGSVLKLAGVLMVGSRLDLQAVVAIEFVSELVVLLLLVYGWMHRWRKDPARSDGSLSWWRENKRRALRFGFWGFLQNQSGLFYGSAPNRLVAAHYLPAPEVALFGLADNLINLVRRFMPTQLFIGLIRPVMVAKYSASQDFSQAAWVANLAYRLNLAILMPGIAFLVTFGEPLFDWLTGGKYPAAAWLVAGLLVLMTTEGMRTMVELMAQAVERNRVLFVSNLVQSASLLLAIPLVLSIGLWGLIVANLVGTVLANLFVVLRLRREGYVFHLNLRKAGAIVIYAVASGLAGWLLAATDVHFLIGGPVVVAVYLALCVWKPPLETDEREVLERVVNRKLTVKSKLPFDDEGKEVK